VDALQALLVAAPGYHRIVYGRLAGEREGLDTFTMLPSGKTLDDKLVLGFFLNDALVGCAEVLRGHPEPATAYIGLLLFSETHQGRGHGQAALHRVEECARKWGCSAIRLAVIATNARAHAFWLREGFSEVLRKRIPDVTGEAIVLQRPLAGNAAQGSV
jgi:GNAT superfamily N-acetyltransferase